MSDSVLRMVLDDLKGLLKDGTITFPQYQAAYQVEIAASHVRSLAVESSSSPKRDHGTVAAGSSLSPKRAQGESQSPVVVKCEVSQSAFPYPLPLPKAKAACEPKAEGRYDGERTCVGGRSLQGGACSCWWWVV